MPCLLYTAPVGDIQIYLVFNPQIPKDAESVLIRLFACVKEVQNWMMSNEVVNEDNSQEKIPIQTRLGRYCLLYDIDIS